MSTIKVLLVLAVVLCPMVSAALLEGLYCGKENCYDVLNVTRASTKSEISKNYRQLARKYHPDKQHDGDAAAHKYADERFKAVATAYEILRDDEARTDYDYMLDNPDAYYAHYYRYYRRRVAPKVDVRLVIFVTVSIISVIQYYSAWQRYESAIKYFMTVPKYRNKALELAQRPASDASAAKKRRGMSKAEQKEALDTLIRGIIEENMDIKGAYAKPEWWDILWVQLIVSPYTIAKYLLWYATWMWRFSIMKQPYEDEQKLYLIRKLLGMGDYQFNALDENTKLDYLERELWIRDNFVEWKQAQDEEMKKQMADNPRHKQYRRYMKNHGPGRMTFED